MYQDLNAKKLRYDLMDVDDNQSQIFYRYDMNPPMEYDIDNHMCSHTPVDEDMAGFFSWVRYSKYSGKCEINGRKGEQWKYVAENTTLDMCYGNNQPLSMFMEDREDITNVDYLMVTFQMFDGSRPKPSTFDIPEECTTTTRSKRLIPDNLINISRHFFKTLFRTHL